MISLGRLSDKPEAIQYFMLAIEYGNLSALKYFKKICTTLEIYCHLTENNIPCCDEITNSNEVKEYNTKKELYQINEHCIKCLEDNIMCLPLGCIHYACVKCYPNVFKYKYCILCQKNV